MQKLMLGLLFCSPFALAGTIQCNAAGDTPEWCGGAAEHLEQWYRHQDGGDELLAEWATFIPPDLGRIGSRTWLTGFELGAFWEIIGAQPPGGETLNLLAYADYINAQPHPVREPGSLWLMGAGLVSLGALRRRKASADRSDESPSPRS